MVGITRGTTRDVSVPATVARALRHPGVVRSAAGFVGTVLSDFFWLQFSVRLGVRRIPVVGVDHPLDATVPFEPARINAYLDFIPFWIRPLGYLGHRFGASALRDHTLAFVGLLERCYREAAEVYRYRMSTTRRPHYYRGRFAVIHLFDPHLLCVPSLHVMIVVLTHSYFRRAFAELGLGGEEASALDADLLRGALEITESVLAIKQHSVNCIPAALYAMSRILPQEVTEHRVESFIEGLFVSGPVDAGTGARLRTFIRARYAELVADGAGDQSWTPAVRRFLVRYGENPAS